jgi:hypothetical protein
MVFTIKEALVMTPFTARELCTMGKTDLLILVNGLIISLME